MDRNEGFRERYGSFDRWDWDDENAILIFSNDGLPTLQIEVSVVGTTEGDSWEWSWGNPNFEPCTKRDIEKIREFGEAKGYNQLTSKFLTADEYTGWEMTAVAVHVLNALGSYRFPTERGFCYLVYRKIEKAGQEKAARPRRRKPPKGRKSQLADS